MPAARRGCKKIVWLAAGPQLQGGTSQLCCVSCESRRDSESLGDGKNAANRKTDCRGGLLDRPIVKTRLQRPQDECGGQNKGTQNKGTQHKRMQNKRTLGVGSSGDSGLVASTPGGSRRKAAGLRKFSDWVELEAGNGRSDCLDRCSCAVGRKIDHSSRCGNRIRDPTPNQRSDCEYSCREVRIRCQPPTQSLRGPERSSRNRSPAKRPRFKPLAHHGAGNGSVGCLLRDRLHRALEPRCNVTSWATRLPWPPRCCSGLPSPS